MIFCCWGCGEIWYDMVCGVVSLGEGGKEACAGRC